MFLWNLHAVKSSKLTLELIFNMLELFVVLKVRVVYECNFTSIKVIS